ncbi:hypothetical protein [Clostridium sp.]|jgi:hypothetical protein|uniref:hypothetical protein n=1 Tax=Clostridium sp. TaxID=1506 RepID=UPI003EEB2E38
MAGRTSNISTSSFKPLDINEIMAVPLAKQKMEDDILNQADKFGQLSSDVLDKDSERATSTINSFKDRASSLSDEVISGGVNRSQFNKLRGLRNETTQEMGSDGFVGNAMANKKKVGQYVNALATKKERQGGYSSADAQKWAQAQVSNFEGTQNEDGSFNSFSGAELSDKFDEDKLIDEAIKRVAGQVSKRAIGIIETGGLPAFYEAVRTKEIKGKDYNTVMASIKNSSETNPDLINHLKQQSFFDGEEGNPLDFGSFKDVEGKDRNGNPTSSYQYVPGESRYAKKMAGFGFMGATKTTKLTDKLLQDAVKKKMWNNGYDEKKMAKLYAFRKGEYLNIKANNLDEIQKLNDDYGMGLQTLESDLKAKKAELVEAGMSQEEINSDKGYIKLKNDYTNSKVGYDNTNSYLTQLNEEALKNLSKNDKAIVKADLLLQEYNEDAVKLVEEKYNVKSGTGEGELGFGWEKYKNDTSKKGVERYNKIIQNEAKRMLASRHGVRGADNPTYDFDIGVQRTDEARKEAIQNNLDADNKAAPYTVIQAPSSSKYSGSKYATYSDMNVENMNPSNVAIAGRKDQTLADVMETKEFTDIMGEEGGFEVLKSFTNDGYTQEGALYNQLVIRMKSDPSKSFTVQIDASGDKTIMKDLYEDLYSSSDGDQSLKGEIGLANLMYMPAIKQAFFRSSSSGQLEVQLPDGTKTDQVTFSKNEDGTYSGTLFGQQMEFDGNSDLKSEQEFAVALKREVEEFMEALENSKK